MANPFKKELGKKIPLADQTVDYKLLLTLVDKRNIKDLVTLKSYLKKRETTLKDWIRDNEGSTSNTYRRRKAQELDMIKGCKRLLKYI